MTLSINTNISALNAARNLASTTQSLSATTERLSSGLRINRASDDAAGLLYYQHAGRDVPWLQPVLPKSLQTTASNEC